tara:strand:- start:361 stop:681 length:321 start_codon:yes stop_codon:yes gene_type:complete
MTLNIDYDLSHKSYQTLLENRDFDIRKNLDILLESPDVNSISNEEILARYVINLISIRKELMENSELLNTNMFTLRVCRNYPFLSQITGEQFFYVAQGTMPVVTSN